MTPAASTTSHQEGVNITINSLIEAQTAFIKHWLQQQAEPLATEAWQWLGAQSLNKYLNADDLTRLINDGILTQPMSDIMRSDVRDIMRTLIYHPANDNVPLSDLVDETQIVTLATYIGNYEQQRNILISTFIGNETFADLLTQTLYHAINDFMETTLDRAGGVGKLMKMGRSSFEKATNRNLDEKLQTYLHRNIKDLAQRAEANAQAHLSNEEVTRLLVTGWARIKDQPVSRLQEYLRETPEHSSIDHLEASLQQSYNRLRLSPYLHSLVAAVVDTWYSNHQFDSIAELAASLNLGPSASMALSTTMIPMLNDALESDWFTTHIKEMLSAFYAQPDIKEGLGLQEL
ncbi:hypothetical protein J3492_10070 [Psychrobacter sp. F1192]|uniref:Uncharacterized protein n=1 Tax=Psychrobacter coccoides TaxID=2818440 RepID=A0ABS3NQ73_9GAMM|nr:hypothetical protein [Psychrobacter coccoides]MBO1531551.1 hypothetical protein [Psychrobacter coccoides]